MLTWIRRWWRHDVDVAHLEDFNDRMLADIGLSRHEIAHRVYGYEERWRLASTGRGVPATRSAERPLPGLPQPKCKSAGQREHDTHGAGS